MRNTPVNSVPEKEPNSKSKEDNIMPLLEACDMLRISIRSLPKGTDMKHLSVSALETQLRVIRKRIYKYLKTVPV